MLVKRYLEDDVVTMAKKRILSIFDSGKSKVSNASLIRSWIGLVCLKSSNLLFMFSSCSLVGLCVIIKAFSRTFLTPASNLVSYSVFWDIGIIIYVLKKALDSIVYKLFLYVIVFLISFVIQITNGNSRPFACLLFETNKALSTFFFVSYATFVSHSNSL